MTTACEGRPGAYKPNQSSQSSPPTSCSANVATSGNCAARLGPATASTRTRLSAAYGTKMPQPVNARRDSSARQVEQWVPAVRNMSPVESKLLLDHFADEMRRRADRGRHIRCKVRVGAAPTGEITYRPHLLGNQWADRESEGRAAGRTDRALGPRMVDRTAFGRCAARRSTDPKASAAAPSHPPGAGVRHPRRGALPRQARFRPVRPWPACR